MVNFLDLGELNARYEPELSAAVQRVIHSGWYILGQEVAAFEKEFADFCGVENCIGVANGLDALQIILRGIGIGRDDEVIVPANTFIATWLAVTNIGAKIVAVDPLEGTGNIDPAAVKSAITTKTRAVIAVHLYGQPAEMRELAVVLAGKNISLIEDAAQAHGAKYEGKRAGALSRAAAFSFYPGKNLGALGDGGAITTDDAQLAAACRKLRNYGSSQKYLHETLGLNSRLDEMQAAILRVKLRCLDSENEIRSRLVDRYVSKLSSSDIVLPVVSALAKSSWHIFAVRHPQRDRIIKALADRGISCNIHYPLPCHSQPAYANHRWPELPISEKLQSEVFSLPLSPVHTPDQIDVVANALVEIISKLD